MALQSEENESIKVSTPRLWAIRNPGKKRAQARVAWALKWGKLKRPNSCQACRKVKVVVAHHNDYRSPLVVEWLCDKCHRNRHASINRALGIKRIYNTTLNRPSSS